MNQWFCAILTLNLGCFGLFQGFKGPKMEKIRPLLYSKSFTVKVALCFYFYNSKLLKEPQSSQILSENCSKTTGSNDLGLMLNHFFLVKTANDYFWEQFLSDDHFFCSMFFVLKKVRNVISVCCNYIILKTCKPDAFFLLSPNVKILIYLEPKT